MSLEDRIARYLHSTATPDEVTELSKCLRESEQARQTYLRLANIHATLASDATLWITPPAAATKSVVTRWKTSAALAAAACVFFAFIVWPRSEVMVGTLVYAEGCDWSLTEGQRVPIGRLKLAQGSAMIRMDGGAELLLRGAVRIELVGSGAARLQHGQLWVRAPEEAAGFTVITPDGPVVDLGTEFHVEAASGETSVHVLEGSVQAAKQIFTSGKAIRLKNDAAHEIVFKPQRLAENLIERPQHEKLIAHESFDYAPGDHDPLLLNAGTGWSGPWRMRRLEDGGSAYTGVTRSMRITPEKSLEAPAGKIFRLRSLAEPLTMNRDRVLYISLRFDEPASMAETPVPTLSLGFRSSTEFLGQHVTLRLNHRHRQLIETGAGSGFASQSTTAPGRNLRLIAKILSREHGDDEVSLRIYEEGETPPSIEPAEWSVTSRSLQLDATLDLFMLQSSSQAPRHIDDLRLGTTWRSVTTP